MGPELAPALEDNLDIQDKPEDQEDLSNTPRSFEKQQIKALSHEDRERIRNGKASLDDIKKESEKAREQAENLIEMAKGQDKISDKEAKNYQKQLNTSSRKQERESIVEDLQKAIAQVNTTRDKNEELERTDPELQKAHQQYDQLVNQNVHLLGTAAAEEYKRWIREQKPSIANIEEQTVKFFQSERPPRLEKYNQLKKTLSKYGISKPTNVPFLAAEGLSERTRFLERIEKREKQLQVMGGLKGKLYSPRAEKEIMKEMIGQTTEAKQEHILQRAKFLERAETNGYAELEAAVQANKISQKSMDNMLDYYKDVEKIEDRFDNIKLWSNFIENEVKLGDKLKDIFKKDPKNDEGYKLAFQAFKHMDFMEKEKFITEQEKKREQEVNQEEHNKELAITAFTQECKTAKQKKIISEKTYLNYEKWIEKEARNATADQIKEFLKVLTSPIASDKYKNLKAYEERRKKFQVDIRTLRDVNPTLTDKEATKWEKQYDEEGWTKREKIANDLGDEITKAKEARVKSRTEKAGLKEIEGEKDPNKRAENNKETAIDAIKGLLNLKAYGSAMKRCAKLLADNPYDEEVLSLLDEIAKFADGQATEANQENQKEIYEEYGDLADRMLNQDTEIKEKSDDVQTKEQALDMTRKDQEQKKTMKAKDRNKKEILEKTKGDEEKKAYAQDFMENTEDDEIIDADTLKGTNVVEINYDREDSKQDKRSLRKQIQQERDRVGERRGSSVIDFKQAKTGRTLDARSSQEAENAQRKEKESLADKMALDIVKITHPNGDHTPDQLAQAKQAALAKLDKKAKTKIERMS